MNTFPLAVPPSQPGIYALCYLPTKMVYVGKSTALNRRYFEWRNVFASNLGFKNMALRDLVSRSAITDWAFKVIKTMPDATNSELLAEEDRVIAALYAKAPDKVLNSMLPTAPRRGLGNTAKTEIIGEGRVMNYRETCRYLGCELKSLQKRLAKYRARGITSVTVDELKARSQQYRPEAR